MRRDFVLALTCLLLLGVPPAGAAYQLGDTVADFTLPALDGQPVSLSDFAGQVVLINFFATWCPPCNEEVPLLQELFEARGPTGLVILGIDLLESPAVVEPWIQQRGLTYPILMAPDWDLFQQFPMAGGFPYNAVLDASGVLRYAEYGLNLDPIIDLVDELLPGEPVPATARSWDSVRALYR